MAGLRFRLILPLVGLVSLLILQGCSSSRRKNRCNTCPKWEDRLEVAP